ncbi:MAG: helix-turn-helix transcriptional regulator [Clostridia bacterium]|nr:helix-turn-helix transcriptional regulator [Clostridia bacterium]
MPGPRRFTELERSVTGISPRTLTQRLRALQDDGLIERVAYAESPPRVEYKLTPMGRELIPIIEMMRAYGQRWLCPREEREPARARRNSPGSRPTAP